MNKNPTDLDYFIECESEKLFGNEPLARAILSYLTKNDKEKYKEILEIFDLIVSSGIKNRINEQKYQDGASDDEL